MLDGEFALGQSALTEALDPLQPFRRSPSGELGRNALVWFHAPHSTTPTPPVAMARSPHGYIASGSLCGFSAGLHEAFLISTSHQEVSIHVAIGGVPIIVGSTFFRAF